jgi:two-component system chemotaxis response regulator CheY
MKILLINDSPVSLRILEDMLKKVRAALEVLTAKDGQEGFEILRQNYNDICLILTDWNMPKMDGLEFMRLMRMEKHLAGIPVIMITATWTEEEQEVVRLVNPDLAGYLISPVKKEELAAAVMPYLR